MLATAARAGTLRDAMQHATPSAGSSGSPATATQLVSISPGLAGRILERLAAEAARWETQAQIETAAADRAGIEANEAEAFAGAAPDGSLGQRRALRKAKRNRTIAADSRRLRDRALELASKAALDAGHLAEAIRTAQLAAELRAAGMLPAAPAELPPVI